MAGSPVEQVKENNEKSIEELNIVEELEEESFSDVEETEEVIAYLVEEGGLDREAVEDLLEGEREELKLETKAVELEEDAIMRLKENLKILGGLTEMILDEERNTESEMDNLSQAVKSREPRYDEEFEEDILNNLERIFEEMEGEFEQLEMLVELEKEILSVLSYAVNETEMAEHLEEFQAFEEEKTEKIGEEKNREKMVKVARALFKSNKENEQRSFKEAAQEANEASKAMEEIDVAHNELGNLHRDLENVIEFVSNLGDAVEDEEFKSHLASVMTKFNNLKEHVEEVSEVSEQNIEVAEEVEHSAEEHSQN